MVGFLQGFVAAVLLTAFEQTVGAFVKPGRNGVAFSSELDTGSREENASKKSGVVELVEVAHRLHDRFEIRARIKRVEQLRGVRQQPVRALDRDPDVVLRRVGQPAVSRQQASSHPSDLPK